MKHYKDFDTVSLGYSDIATLILVGISKDNLVTTQLSFGEDGHYQAYLVDEEDVLIGEHYKLVYKGRNWLKIYDDEQLVFSISAQKIRVYRAAQRGCIIQIIK